MSMLSIQTFTVATDQTAARLESLSDGAHRLYVRWMSDDSSWMHNLKDYARRYQRDYETVCSYSKELLAHGLITKIKFRSVKGHNAGSHTVAHQIAQTPNQEITLTLIRDYKNRSDMFEAQKETLEKWKSQDREKPESGKTRIRKNQVLSNKQVSSKEKGNKVLSSSSSNLTENQKEQMKTTTTTWKITNKQKELAKDKGLDIELELEEHNEYCKENEIRNTSTGFTKRLKIAKAETEEVKQHPGFMNPKNVTNPLSQSHPNSFHRETVDIYHYPESEYPDGLIIDHDQHCEKQ